MATTKETDGYTAEGRTLEVEDAAQGSYPLNKTAVADDETRGVTLEVDTLANGEPARVSSAPLADTPGYTAEGRALEAEEISQVGYPEHSER